MSGIYDLGSRDADARFLCRKGLAGAIRRDLINDGMETIYNLTSGLEGRINGCAFHKSKGLSSDVCG